MVSSSSSLTAVNNEEQPKLTLDTPRLLSTYNDRIRPLLDAVDKLRHLKVMNEGIQLPTIVVVGDQSSGKSSVLESLAGISIPCGHGICTRVPLIMRLQNQSDDNPEAQPQFYLEYNGKIVHTDEPHISEAISTATDEIAGYKKGISKTPLTLVVKKQGVPDLTMVDLPGITRVPVHGQPDDICEQVYNIIMEYISPKESIILNVLSATVDFSTCESIRMSQRVDKSGERTLAVVTKSDMAPQGLIEKVTADDVNIGLGYVCVRNRVGNESYERARIEEAELFSTHPLLSSMDKSIVGIPVLAQKLVDVQAISIAKCLPEIVRTINEKLNQNVADLNKLPHSISSPTDANVALLRILGLAKDSLNKVLVSGDFDEYPDEGYMHSTTRIADMVEDYVKELRFKSDQFAKRDMFLMEEIRVLKETKRVELRNFLSKPAFLTMLKRKVNEISATCIEFVEKVWSYIEDVVVRVVTLCSEDYPQIQTFTIRVVRNLITNIREKSVGRVEEMLEMEKVVDYTCNEEYYTTWNALMAARPDFMAIIDDPSKSQLFYAADYGEIDVGYLRADPNLAQYAFDLRMRLSAYWKIVIRRLVDGAALHLMFSVQNLVNKKMGSEIMDELTGPSGAGMKILLKESLSVAAKRSRLNKSIELLKESKEVVNKIMDGIASE